MASDAPDPAELAKVLLGPELNVRRGENVIIETWTHSLAYSTACVVEARRLGAHPMLLLEDESAYWRSLDIAPAVGRWSRVGGHEWAALAKAHAYVFFPGPEDRPRFNQLPPTQRSALTTYNAEWYRRAKAARLRGVRCMLGYASDAQARFWGVRAPEWRDGLLRATLGVEYAHLQRQGRAVAERLRTGKLLHITAANGSEVRLRLRHRAPVVEDGVVDRTDLDAGRNLATSPPGTVVVAVDESSAEGIAVANRASYLRGGRVEGGQWEVHAGHLANAWYTEGQEIFEAGYRDAPKGKDVVGLVSIGLNPKIGPGLPQVEDQEAGAVTIAVGGNQGSWIVLAEATVAVDERPLLDRGHLL
jgi:leucyl aminopeptidase (aminopeptidase T)